MKFWSYNWSHVICLVLITFPMTLCFGSLILCSQWYNNTLLFTLCYSKHNYWWWKLSLVVNINIILYNMKITPHLYCPFMNRMYWSTMSWNGSLWHNTFAVSLWPTDLCNTGQTVQFILIHIWFILLNFMYTPLPEMENTNCNNRASS